MTAKEFLRQYEYAERKAKRLREEYEEERIKIDAVRSVTDNDGMPHGYNISKPTEEKAIRLADKAMLWVDAELNAIAIRQEVFDVINQVDGIDGDILYQRYIKRKTWNNVCKEVYLSWYGVNTHHAAALIKVQEIIDRSHT